MLTIAGVAVGALLLYKVANKAYSATRLNFLVKKLGFKFQGLQPVLIVDIAAQNPTSTPFDLGAITGKIYTNGNYLADIGYFNPITIGPLKETIIAIPIQLSNVITAAKQLIDLFSGGTIKGGIQMRIQGTVNVDQIPAPIDINFSAI